MENSKHKITLMLVMKCAKSMRPEWTVNRKPEASSVHKIRLEYQIRRGKLKV
jgi:hypothetical protein